MYMMYNMIRKQLYISQRQDLALKRRARSLGVSEAELVRQALDRSLELEISTPPDPGRRKALVTLLDNSRSLARRHRFEGAKPLREDLYESREARWTS